MTDKIVKEDENFIWFETEHGIGYVVSKNAYFDYHPISPKQYKEYAGTLPDNPTSLRSTQYPYG